MDDFQINLLLEAGFLGEDLYTDNGYEIYAVRLHAYFDYADITVCFTYSVYNRETGSEVRVHDRLVYSVRHETLEQAVREVKNYLRGFCVFW